MRINFENALGIHDTALKLRSRRAGVLANNLANADTPNFRARDIDFQHLLRQQTQGAEINQGQRKVDQAVKNVTMRVTHARHQPGIDSANGALLASASLRETDLLYRTPYQPAIDGNTVEEHIEQAEYTKNALAFQASFRFLDGAFKGLKTAIRGEL